ncbi:MAG: hypothetical protein GY769_06220 [bacterium]|nr:hypothetical protein [bacterium]
MSGNLAAEMACLARESLGAPKESLGLTKDLLALREPLLQTQEGPRIFEQSPTTLEARRKPAGVEGTDLAGPQLLAHDLLGQLATSCAVDPG